jgi:ketosteroid isomerase-like protein
VSDGDELIRDVWDRWNAGLREFDLEILDPEVEIHSGLTGQVFKGATGVRDWTAEIDEQFEAWNISADEIDRQSADRLVVRGAIRARGRQSGIDLDQPVTWTVDLRDGRILRLINFLGVAPEANE